MGLYFQYLRFMILVFAAMFALALPSVVLNSCGMAYAASGDVPDIWIRSSIGNIGSGWLLNVRVPTKLCISINANMCTRMQSVRWV
jgi:hypothetical protein